MHWIAGCVPSSTARRRSAGSPPARMKASVAAAALALALPAAAQAPARNAQVDGILLATTAPSLEAPIRKLVSFGTRHTLSRTDSDTHGIGAARRWIKAELDQCSRAAGGRPPGEPRSFTPPPPPRRPPPG